VQRKKPKKLDPEKLPEAPAPPSPAEAAVAQRLLDGREKRMRPPKLKFERNKGAVEISFEDDSDRRALLAMHSATGLRNAMAVDLLMDQLARLGGADADKLDVRRTNNAIAMLDELEPADGQEAMLTAQMVAVHFAAMDCLARALHPSQSFAGRELNLKHGAKLSRIYAEQVAALDKHRRKGQQTVTVEHVHVHDGGQAVVGAVVGQRLA
jgi:hypothetical protein